MKTNRTKPKTAERLPSDNMTVRVNVTESRYGTPTPEIEVTIPHSWPVRRLKAMLYGLAMDVEVLTPKGEGWVTEIEVLAEGRGRVYLELIEGGLAETERGRAVLADVVQRQVELVRIQ